MSAAACFTHSCIMEGAASNCTSTVTALAQENAIVAAQRPHRKNRLLNCYEDTGSLFLGISGDTVRTCYEIIHLFFALKK